MLEYSKKSLLFKMHLQAYLAQIPYYAVESVEGNKSVVAGVPER